MPYITWACNCLSLSSSNRHITFRLPLLQVRHDTIATQDTSLDGTFVWHDDAIIIILFILLGSSLLMRSQRCSFSQYGRLCRSSSCTCECHCQAIAGQGTVSGALYCFASANRHSKPSSTPSACGLTAAGNDCNWPVKATVVIKQNRVRNAALTCTQKT